MNAKIKNIIEKQKMVSSLERNRYQPRFDQRISKLPIYLGFEIKLLAQIAKEEKWNLDATSYSNNQEPPLYNANSFYEYLDEYHDHLVDILLKDIDEMPLYINDKYASNRAIAKWRMKIGK
jgi:hypothetical protein